MNTNLGRHAGVSASHLFSKKVTCKQGNNKVTLMSRTDFHYFEKGMNGHALQLERGVIWDLLIGPNSSFKL